jgi:hypothetical protein
MTVISTTVKIRAGLVHIVAALRLGRVLLYSAASLRPGERQLN